MNKNNNLIIGIIAIVVIALVYYVARPGAPKQRIQKIQLFWVLQFR